jgi:hypothetical protein
MNNAIKNDIYGIIKGKEGPSSGGKPRLFGIAYAN